MSRRPDLQIATQFYSQDEGRQQFQHYNQIYQRKQAAVQIFQQLLSSNLAKKFISCWKTLKSLVTEPRIKYRHRSAAHYDYNEAYSTKYATHKIMTQQRYRGLTRTRSVDPKIQLSRAQLLNQIAQKLKGSRKSNHSYESNNFQVLKKLSKLETLMKDIRNANEMSHQNAIISSRVDYEKQKNHDQFALMLSEINSLKKEIREIKNQNDQIIKSQVSKSRFEDWGRKQHHHHYYQQNQPQKQMHRLLYPDHHHQRYPSQEYKKIIFSQSNQKYDQIKHHQYRNHETLNVNSVQPVSHYHQNNFTPINPPPYNIQVHQPGVSQKKIPPPSRIEDRRTIIKNLFQSNQQQQFTNQNLQSKHHINGIRVTQNSNNAQRTINYSYNNNHHNQINNVNKFTNNTNQLPPKQKANPCPHCGRACQCPVNYRQNRWI